VTTYDKLTRRNGKYRHENYNRLRENRSPSACRLDGRRAVGDRDKREKEIPGSFEGLVGRGTKFGVRSAGAGVERERERERDAKGGRYITIKPRILRELCPRSESRGISRGAVCRYQNSVTMATHQLSNAARSLRNLHFAANVTRARACMCVHSSSMCPL